MRIDEIKVRMFTLKEVGRLYFTRPLGQTVFDVVVEPQGEIANGSAKLTLAYDYAIVPEVLRIGQRVSLALGANGQYTCLFSAANGETTDWAAVVVRQMCAATTLSTKQSTGPT